MHALDWTICLASLAVVLVQGSRLGRAQRTNDDYFFGGRQMNWLPVALSLFATALHCVWFVGYRRVRPAACHDAPGD